jgi:hypothetical protein
MSSTTDAYGLNPNSEHQRWSRWVWLVRADRKRPTKAEVIDNLRRWCRAGFKTTVGRVRCDVVVNGQGTFYRMAAEIEGPVAHDTEYRQAVFHDFRVKMVEGGFGYGAGLVRQDVTLLAGDAEDGKPRTQLLVMPSLREVLAPLAPLVTPGGRRG